MKPYVCIAFLFIVCFFRIGNAQIQFLAPGSEWHYGFHVPGLVQARGFTHFQLTGDTTLHDTAASIITRTHYYFDYDNPTVPIDTVFSDPVYMVQFGDSILISHGNEFRFLWRTNVMIGDSYEIPDEYIPFTIHVNNVGVEIFNGVEVRVIDVEGGSMYGQWGNAKIYDQFGPENGFYYYVCWGAYDCYDAKLCRYRNDNMGEIQFTGAVCDLVITDVITEPSGHISIHPNPVTDELWIHLPERSTGEIHLEIFSMTGQLVSSRRYEAVMPLKHDVSALASGIYVCRVHSISGVWSEKVVKERG